ncbi:MAG: metalloregulator ArsR/SmtB family transcription factor [Planctomycetes bacterium]|nr:metalloregulator ArsR/SmtB family transcription factor [Planctomycetota bacterium]
MRNRTDKSARGPDLTELGPVFFALGDRTRLRLVTLLCAGGALSITALTASTRLTRQAVTKHLHVLESAGVATATKIGRERLWELNPEPLDEARASLELIGRQWEDALGRLKKAVEG